MPNAVRFLPLVVAVLAAACGGKILDDPNAKHDGMRDDFAGSSSGSGGVTTPAPADPLPTPPEPSPTPTGSRPTVEDACGVICERNGKCGALQTDCLSRCADEIHGAAACSREANAYIHCYADNLEPGCAALPPTCESAYCAYTQCAGKVVPTYCR